MRKLVLEAHETKFLMGLFISFLMLFLIIFISILLQLAGSEASRKAFLGVLVYLAFAAVVIALLLFSLKRLRERARKATLLAKESILEENRLLFPLELEFEYGRVELFNHPERRRLIKDFKALEKKRTSIFEFPNKEFKFIGTYEEGFASFPAIRILTKPYEGTMVLFMTNKGTVRAKRVLTLSPSEGNIAVVIEGQERDLTGRFYLPSEQRKKVKIFLSSPENPAINIKIGDSSLQEFTYSMLPDEKMVVFASYGSLSIGNLLRTLNYSKVALGHGEFLLRFKLSKPRRKEVASYKFRVELEGEEGYGIN